MSLAARASSIRQASCHFLALSVILFFLFKEPWSDFR